MNPKLTDVVRSQIDSLPDLWNKGIPWKKWPSPKWWPAGWCCWKQSMKETLADWCWSRSNMEKSSDSHHRSDYHFPQGHCWRGVPEHNKQTKSSRIIEGNTFFSFLSWVLMIRMDQGISSHFGSWALTCWFLDRQQSLIKDIQPSNNRSLASEQNDAINLLSWELRNSCFDSDENDWHCDSCNLVIWFRAQGSPKRCDRSWLRPNPEVWPPSLVWSSWVVGIRSGKRSMYV